MTASADVRRSSRSGREQPRQRDLQGDRLLGVVERDGDRRRLLLEQARPRARAGQRLLGEDALLGLGEQVRAVAPRGAQVVAAEVEPVVGEQRLGALVVERRPLELEEDQRGLDLRAALLHELQQRAALRVGGGRREVQHRVGAGATDQLLQRRELAASRRRARARRARRPCPHAPPRTRRRAVARPRAAPRRRLRHRAAGPDPRRPLRPPGRRLRSRPWPERLRRAQPVEHQREVTPPRVGRRAQAHHGGGAAHHHRDVGLGRVERASCPAPWRAPSACSSTPPARPPPRRRSGR